MKTVLISLVSAIVGGLMVICVTGQPSSLESRANAQPTPERRGPGFPLTPIIPKKKKKNQQPVITVPSIITLPPLTPPPRTGGRNDGHSHDHHSHDHHRHDHQQPIALSAEERINIAVYEKVNRSVVNITTENIRNERFFLVESLSEGTGSGSVIDKRGYIVTNYHVIEEARTISVTLYDGSTHQAKLIGADRVSDIAVIKIETSEKRLFPVTLGDSRPLKVGRRVFAIGNPFGFERTLSTGIISSLNRSLKLRGARKVHSMIQVDASMNPGNSGGPLLDSTGRMIGINTAIASKNGQSAGIGFAVPVSVVRRVVPQLIKNGKIERPDIGITRVYEANNGLLIAQLDPKGAAAKAGLRGPQIVRSQRGPFIVEKIDRTAADLIIGCDNKKTKTVEQFLSIIESKRPGDIVKLIIVRNGRTITVAVPLGR